ncbi:MAG: hypothetical protein ICV55_03270 [Coleofasciculus sp. C3-bin4]|nr:hypothetical protein [Coleofasciculus sp. C3-bin4]
MKKKHPQQQATPPTNALNILAVKRSPKQVEPPQEQPAAERIEKPVQDAASAKEPVVPTPVDEPAHAATASSTSSPDQEALFQAVGIIKGDITADGEKFFVTIAEKQYGLYYANSHKRAYDALKKEISNTGVTQQRLIVYPRITHYPGGKQPYRLAFQLVGFVGHEASEEGITSVLEDFEFQISGLWQFIPVCRVPCISVFKNFNKQRLEYIKSAPLDKKVNFMKASHIPVLWKDAPVPPFRFNPKLDKDTQGKASFVQIKARFNSAGDNFEFLSLLAIPSEEPPNYQKQVRRIRLRRRGPNWLLQKLGKALHWQFQTPTLSPEPLVLPLNQSLSPRWSPPNNRNPRLK